jgi:hypothetical protein
VRTAAAEPSPPPIPVFVAGEYELEDLELLVLSVPYSEFFPSDRFPNRLDRVYRGDDGEVHVETILTSEDTHGLPFVVYISPVAVSPSGEELATAVCARGDCGGFIPPSEDAVTALYRSSDGGGTWWRDAEFAGGVRAQGWLDGEVVLWTASLPSGEPPPVEQRLRLHPSGKPLTAPDGASSDYAAPYLFESPQGPLWRSDDGLVDASGVTVVAFAGFPSARPTRVALLSDGTVFWTWTAVDRSSSYFAAVFDATGVQLTATLVVPYGCCSATADGRLLVPEVAPLPEWVDAYGEELPELQNGEPYGRWVPGFLDPETGAIEAITDPFLRAVYRNRDQIRVLAVVVGD